VRIAQASEQDAFSQDVRLGILDAAKETGFEIIIDDKLPKELNDMAATLVKVKQMKPDVLVVSGHTKGALTAIRQIAEIESRCSNVSNDTLRCCEIIKTTW
jgi:ABC-type branched-chain amino acid transport systems, periplasmic component